MTETARPRPKRPDTFARTEYEGAGADMWLPRGSALSVYRDPSPVEADTLVRFVPERALAKTLRYLSDEGLSVFAKALVRANRLSPACARESHRRSADRRTGGRALGFGAEGGEPS
jgi:hypothetical protein